LRLLGILISFVFVAVLIKVQDNLQKESHLQHFIASLQMNEI